jgi:hypothetical protein
MRRVIGMDIHRTFAEVVFWEDGKLRPEGRVSMTRSGLEGFGHSLGKEDEVVIEATGNPLAVVRVLSPYVARVIMANPLQVKAIAHAHVKTDNIDAGMLASLRAANFLPEVWCRIRIPSAGADWWHAATRLSGTARGSRMRCTRSPACAGAGSARPSDPALPTCRPVRTAGPDLAGATAHAR